MAPNAKRNNKRKNTRVKGRAQSKFTLPTAKKKVIKDLAPIAETKKFLGWQDGTPTGVREVYLPITSAAQLIVPNTFCFMQSQRDLPILFSSMEGREIFSKYLQEKLLITYPNGSGSPVSPPRPLEVIYGFCTPANLTNLTTHTADTVSQEQFTAHVVQQVIQDFNDADDNMEFKDRERRNYNITGRFKVMPSLDAQITQQIGARTGVAPIRKNVSWPMMKKVRYHRSNDSNGNSEPFMYPNGAYVPFLILYNRDFVQYQANTTDESGKVTLQSQVKVSYNSCHWYQDM